MPHTTPPAPPSGAHDDTLSPAPAASPSAPPARPRTTWRGPVLCGAAMATVGTSVLASKLIGAAVEPFAATAWRHALALPLLLALCAWRRPRWPALGRRDRGLLLLQAAAGSVGYTVLLIAGTALASAADAGIVAGTLPAMATLFAVVALGERPAGAALVGIALATSGVLLLGADPGAGAATALPHRSLGLVLVAGAVACEVLFILGQKRLRVALDPLVMATLMSAGGLLLATPAATMVAAWHLSPASAWPSDASAWAAIAWYAWVPTVLGFWLWYAGAREASATQAAAATAWLPVVAVLGAATLLGEPLSPMQGLALALVVAGVWAGSRPRR